MSYLERLRNRQSGMNGTEKNTQPYRTEVAKVAKGAFATFDTSSDKGTQVFFEPPSLKQPSAPPATEPPPRDQQEDPSLMAECRTCLRYDPRGHYCGHKLRVIREGEVLICAGKGYSPKGSPWKECQS